MPPELTKRKSVPALSLRLSSLEADDKPRLIWGQVTYLRNSRSEPLLSLPKDDFSSQKKSRAHTVGGKKYQEVLTSGSLRSKSVGASINRLVTKESTPVIDNGSRQLFEVLSPPSIYRESLKNPLNHSNEASKLLIAPVSKTLQLPPIECMLEMVEAVSTDDTGPSISSQLSTPCLQDFHKLQAHPVSPSGYQLSELGINESKALTFTRPPTYSRPSRSLQTSALFTAVSDDTISLGVSETPKILEPPGNHREMVLGTLCDAEESLGGSSNHHRSPKIRKFTDFSGLVATFGTPKNSHNAISREKSHQYESINYTEANKCRSISLGNSSDIGQGSSSSTIVAQPIEDNQRPLDSYKAPNEPQINNQGPIHEIMETENTKTSKSEHEDSSISKEESKHESAGAALKKSRLAAWKHIKLNSFSSQKKNHGSQSKGEEKGTAINSYMSSETGYKTSKLKKSPSLLFRLWNSITPEIVPDPKSTRNHQQRGTPPNDNQKAPAHPLQVQSTTAEQVKKDRERIVQQELACQRPGKENTRIVEAGGKIECNSLKERGSESIAADDSPGLGTATSRIWGVGKVGDDVKGLKQEISKGKIAIDDFPESRKTRKRYPILSPDGPPVSHQKPPALRKIERLGISWNKSIQEYAGSLGHVHHSGERLVSDTFRSGSSGYPSGYTDAGMPTLSSMKTKIKEFEEEPLFEESSLAADWDIAMRMMEEISKEDHKLKRVGAIKLKRNSDGNVGPVRDGIGRSFSRSSESMMRSNKNERTKLVELTIEGLENEDCDEVEGEYSGAASTESWGYKSIEEVDSVYVK